MTKSEITTISSALQSAPVLRTSGGTPYITATVGGFSCTISGEIEETDDEAFRTRVIEQFVRDAKRPVFPRHKKIDNTQSANDAQEAYIWWLQHSPSLYPQIKAWADELRRLRETDRQLGLHPGTDWKEYKRRSEAIRRARYKTESEIMKFNKGRMLSVKALEREYHTLPKSYFEKYVEEPTLF